MQGEQFEAVERLVVAPSAGVFEPAPISSCGSIEAGQIVGHLMSGSERTPVVSPFAGRRGATLAWNGERMVSRQPVMWLSVGQTP